MNITIWYSDFQHFPMLAGRINWLLNSGHIKINKIASNFIIIQGKEQYLKVLYQS